jgi:hypothetical protein
MATQSTTSLAKNATNIQHDKSSAPHRTKVRQAFYALVANAMGARKTSTLKLGSNGGAAESTHPTCTRRIIDEVVYKAEDIHTSR